MARGLVLVGALALVACGEPLPLSSTDQAVTVSPSAWDFGSATVGTEVGPRGITVSYGTGYGSDTVLAITSCPDFRIDLQGNPLPYEIYRICETGQAACEFIDIQTLLFDVYFRPSVANVESCNVVIDFADAPDRIVPLSGTGTAPPIDITLVQPAAPSIDFGDVLALQVSAPRVITVRSDGGEVLDITSAGVTAGAGFTQTAGTAPISLSTGASADYAVTCTPPGPGITTGNFRISSTDPDEANLDIALRCNGIQSALAIDPSPATLPATRVGESSRMDITLSNTGTAALMIESTAVSGDGLAIIAPPAMTQNPASGSTVMTVEFTPTIDGDVAGLLTVTFDGAQTRQIALTGPGRVATLSVTPGGQVDFGPICVGETASELFVALDTGTGGFIVEGVALAGAGFSLLPMMPPMYPAPVAPLGGSTVTFLVSAAPIAAGELAATVSIATDIPDRPSETIELHALGLAGGTTATPAELDTGSAVVGEGGGGRVVSLSNCEAEPLTITSVAIEGDDAGEFAIVTVPVSMVVPPGSSAAYLLELRPTSTGPKAATFHIVHSRGTADVSLIGDGLDPSGHADGDSRGSYYACAATGEPAGVILIAAALALVCRRRRR